MDNSNRKAKLEFETYLKDNLNYETMSKMGFIEYMQLIAHLFSELNKLKNLGIQKNDLEPFIKNQYTTVMNVADDSDILFERRFSAITEEIVEFCPSPFFWDTDFETYMKKWDKRFHGNWYEHV